MQQFDEYISSLIFLKFINNNNITLSRYKFFWSAEENFVTKQAYPQYEQTNNALQ